MRTKPQRRGQLKFTGRVFLSFISKTAMRTQVRVCANVLIKFVFHFKRSVVVHRSETKMNLNDSSAVTVLNGFGTSGIILAYKNKNVFMQNVCVYVFTGVSIKFVMEIGTPKKYIPAARKKAKFGVAYYFYYYNVIKK